MIDDSLPAPSILGPNDFYMERIAVKLGRLSLRTVHQVVADQRHESYLLICYPDFGIPEDAIVIEAADQVHILPGPCASHLNKPNPFVLQRLGQRHSFRMGNDILHCFPVWLRQFHLPGPGKGALTC